MATADCVAWFKHAWPGDWKDHFKDPDEITAWLEKRHIHIATRKKPQYQTTNPVQATNRGHISFELKSPEENTVTAFRFTNRESALYDAIERAFRLLEQRALRQRAVASPPNTRRRRPSPTPSDKDTIGERAQAQREQEKAQAEK